MTTDSTDGNGLSAAQSDGFDENSPHSPANGPGAVQLAQANGAPTIPMPGPGERVTVPENTAGPRGCFRLQGTAPCCRTPPAEG